MKRVYARGGKDFYRDVAQKIPEEKVAFILRIRSYCRFNFYGEVHRTGDEEQMMGLLVKGLSIGLIIAGGNPDDGTERNSGELGGAVAVFLHEAERRVAIVEDRN